MEREDGLSVSEGSMLGLVMVRDVAGKVGEKHRGGGLWIFGLGLVSPDWFYHRKLITSTKAELSSPSLTNSRGIICPFLVMNCPSSLGNGPLVRLM